MPRRSPVHCSRANISRGPGCAASQSGRRASATGSSGLSSSSRSRPYRSEVFGAKIASSSVKPVGTKRILGSRASTIDRCNSVVDLAKNSWHRSITGIQDIASDKLWDCDPVVLLPTARARVAQTRSSPTAPPPALDSPAPFDLQQDRA